MCSPCSPVEECRPSSSSSENTEIPTDTSDKILKTKCCKLNKGSNLMFFPDLRSSTIADSVDSSDSDIDSPEIRDVSPEPFRKVHPESEIPTTSTSVTSEHNIVQESGNPTATLLTHPLITKPDEDSDSLNIQPLQDYILGSGDFITFKKSELKVWEVIMVILGISTRFGVSYKLRRTLIKAIKLFAGPQCAS